MDILKYVTPKSIDKFVGNKIQTKHIVAFLSNKSPSKNILCVIGPDGCGKTTLCNLLFAKYNKQALEVGKDNLVGNDIKLILQNFANNMTIDTIMLKKEKVVFVDDIDILMNVDKFIFSKLLSVDKILKKNNIKVIMTCNLSGEKKVSEHSKDLDTIKLSYPFYKDSYAYILDSFDINDFEHDPVRVLEVSQKCKGSIRDIILNLESSTDDLKQKNTEEAFKDLNNFEVSRKILGRNYRNDDLEYYQKCDIGIIPYMLYENLPDELDANYKFKRGKNMHSMIDYYMSVNSYYIDAAMFEEKAYSTLDWQFLTYGNMLKMGSIHCALEGLEKKATTKDVNYRFSQMLSKMSHKNILAKKVKGISSNINVSNMMILNAADIHAQSSSNESDAVSDSSHSTTDGEEHKVNPSPTTKKLAEVKSSKISKANKTSKASKTSKPVKTSKTLKPLERKTKLSNEETSIVNTYGKYFV
jgi:ABC-type Fe3+/spermidine/putrescine transport system ATPase subunit